MAATGRMRHLPTLECLKSTSAKERNVFRFRSAAFMMLLAITTIPLVEAKEGPPSYSVTDPTGDTTGSYGQVASFIDITAGTVQWNNTEILFAVQVADTTYDVATGIAQGELWLRFSYRGDIFDAVVFTAPSSLPDSPANGRILAVAHGELFRLTSDSWTSLAQFEVDGDGAAYVMSFPWDAINTVDDFSPGPGEPIQFVGFESSWSADPVARYHQPNPLGLASPFQVDAAVLPADAIGQRPGSTGTLSLSTQLPIRFSNGEASTFFWPVEVTNAGTGEAEVAFEISSSSPSTETRIPSLLVVKAGQTKTLPVYITVPFAHEHGTQRTYTLKADSLQGHVEMVLGITYPAIPQPAGHHPQLYLHGAGPGLAGAEFSSGPLWFNAADEDPASTATKLTPSVTVCTLAGQDDIFGVEWVFALRPQLVIGIDGQPTRPAHARLTIGTEVLLAPGTLSARLFVYNTTSNLYDSAETFSEAEAALISHVPIEQITGPGQATFELDIQLPVQLDRQEPSKQLNLGLVLEYCPDGLPEPLGSAFGEAAALSYLKPIAWIGSGSTVDMPLNEFHDYLPIPLSASGITIFEANPARAARSGAQVLWKPAVAATNAEERYQLDLFGTGKENARLLATSPMSLSGEAQTVPVAFDTPDARDGDVFDVILQVTSVDDPSDSASIRLSVTVDSGSTLDDAAALDALLNGNKESPTIGPFSVVLVLAALALAGRRDV
ncbi:MAG: hypothetical protein ACYC2H_01155 [Thermoplasmatota archaeon]